jgi:O-antigen biosynthesis protein
MILDVGCNFGFLGRNLNFQPKNLSGIDILELPKVTNYKKIYQKDLNDLTFNYLKEKFDVVVFADVLEHLKSPQKTLGGLLKNLKTDGHIILSVPNMDQFVVRVLHSINIHPKMENGLFDKTHIHEFNLVKTKKLVTQAGLEIEKTIFVPPPLPLLPNLIGRNPTTIFNTGQPLHLIYWLLYRLCQKFPPFLAYQIIIVAKPEG